MRLRNVTGAREAIAESDYVIHNPQECRGSWHKVFGNDHPIRIEIGMGKGRFIMDLARQNPDVNYVGIEKFSSVLIRGVQKQEADPLQNLCFIRMDAEEITSVFGAGEVDRIYLNFSDPWPKDRHAKRRLPSREFLRRYGEILIPDGVVEFKTDNRDLFQFALEELEPAGWKLLQMTEDLHHDAQMMQGNVMTEYEERFSSKGNPIYKYIIAREKEVTMEYQFTADNFEDEVLKSEIPVLVDFYADWCGPCKMMAPVIAQMAEKYEGKVKIGKCNTEEEDGLARMYRVMNIPNMKIFVKGEIVGNIVGAVQPDELEAEIKKVCGEKG